jgi:hypothetical protein
VQRTDLNADPHTSAPDPPGASLSLLLPAVISLQSEQMQSGDTLNVLALAGFFKSDSNLLRF